MGDATSADTKCAPKGTDSASDGKRMGSTPADSHGACTHRLRIPWEPIRPGKTLASMWPYSAALKSGEVSATPAEGEVQQEVHTAG